MKAEKCDHCTSIELTPRNRSNIHQRCLLQKYTTMSVCHFTSVILFSVLPRVKSYWTNFSLNGLLGIFPRVAQLKKEEKGHKGIILFSVLPRVKSCWTNFETPDRTLKLLRSNIQCSPLSLNVLVGLFRESLSSANY